VNASQENTGTLADAVEHAAHLLDQDPILAAEQASAILEVAPQHPPALLLLAAAQRRQGKVTEALAQLEPLAQSQTAWASAQYELALALADAGRGDEAIKALRATVALKPQHPEAWRRLADHLLATGDTQGGDAAYARHIQCSASTPSLQRAAAAMVANDMPKAESVLKDHLKSSPTDVPAIRMLAEVAVRCGQNEAAEKLLHRCLELAPSFNAARYNYAVLLQRQNDSASALVEIERLLEDDPKSPSYRNLCAVILSRIGEYERSSKIYAQLLAEYPGNAKVWLSYGHVLKTEGRQETCIDAYRQSIARDPAFGEAYWSLANLKTFRFKDKDLLAIQHQLDDSTLSDENRLHFHFALGKASEDNKDHSSAFEHYDKGNALHHSKLNYDADMNSTRVQRLKSNFSREFFSARAGFGCDAPDPIFIVGMPRSGSTLLEQILSSHSQVEGTTELPDIISMAKDLRQEAGSQEIVAYAEMLATKNATQLRELGEQYIENTRVHRKTDRPFFIDKMPNNFLHTGMIHLVLPNAKIIDTRRHPLGCCFSNFKQYYARGQSFSYKQSDMGRFYRDYVELMAHYDAVLPGKVHRVIYEQTVADTETQVRQVLDYCGLDFEPACLRFFENERPVRTASSEQVRQPIYREGMEQWMHYEQWLDPLKAELGAVLDHYPNSPY
jgi:tetratricopeptide (TPR) repeat protein